MIILDGNSNVGPIVQHSFMAMHPELKDRLKVIRQEGRTPYLYADLSNIGEDPSLQQFYANRIEIPTEYLEPFDVAFIEMRDWAKQDLDKSNQAFGQMLVALRQALKAEFGLEIWHLDLSRNNVSGKLFANKDVRDALPCLTALNMNDTPLSQRGLSCIAQLKTLQWLSVDSCQYLAGDIAKETFPNVKTVSAKYIEVPRITGFIERFPNASNFYFTQYSGHNKPLLGAMCPVEMGYAINPTLQKPCGHIVASEYAGSPEKNMKKCPCCNTIVQKALPFSPSVTQVSQVKKKWKIALLDYCGHTINNKLYFHEACGHLFTQDTLSRIYQEKLTELEGNEQEKDQKIYNIFEKYACVGCQSRNVECAMELRRVYIEPDQDAETTTFVSIAALETFMSPQAKEV